MLNRALITTALVTGTILLPFETASAQTSDAVTAPPISVTAQRKAVPAFEAPGFVEVITREEIELRSPSSLDDAIGQVPGLSFFGGPRRTGEEPSIRGFSGPDVIVTIDGARQNFNSGHDGRVFIDPQFLSEAEIVKGSSSALYGSGGTGGVIALRTVTAEDFLREGETMGGRLSGSYATNDGEGAVTATAFAKPLDNIDLLAGFQFRKSGDIQLGGDGELNAQDDIRSGLVKGSVAFGDGHTAKAAYQIFDNEAIEPNNGQDATGDTADKDVRNQSVALTYEFAPSTTPFVDLSVIAYRNSSFVDETETDSTDAGVLQTRELKTLGVDIANTSRIEIDAVGDVALTYGGEVYRDKADGEFGGGTRGGVVAGTQRFYGAFLQSEFTWDDAFGLPEAELVVTPGVRYDIYKAEGSGAAANLNADETALSPKVSVRVSLVPWAFAYGSFAEAFRAPTLDELFATGTHFAIGLGTNEFIINPDLKPQETTTWEGGAGFEFEDLGFEGDSLQTKAGFYRINGKDFIDLEVTAPAATCFFLGTDCGTSQSVNIGDAEINGIEANVTYDTPRFLIEATYHRMNTENTQTGEPLTLEQPDTVTLDGRLKVSEGDGTFGYRMAAVDGFDEGTDASRHRDGYVLHDFYARWEPKEGLADGLALGVTLKNAFDRRYSRIASDVVEAGRDLRFDASYTLRW